MFCKFCGKNNPDEANFCGNCGKALKAAPSSYRPGPGRYGVKAIMLSILFLTGILALAVLVFEADTYKYEKVPSPLVKQLKRVKKSSTKDIGFNVTLTPQEIDSYLNEELFNKNLSGFNAIRTTLIEGEMELSLSGNFLYIPSILRLRVRPENSDGKFKLSTSNVSLGRVSLPHFIYPALFQRYPWLNLDYLLSLSGVKLEELKIERGAISLRGVWSG